MFRAAVRNKLYYKNGVMLLENVQNKKINDEMSERILEAAEEIVCSQGADSLTVRKLLKKLGITNRVFYNRFKNIDEVLHIIYRNTVQKVRDVLQSEKIDSEKDFFELVMNLVTNSLLVSYDSKMRFNQYVFENDSVSQGNYNWWTTEIRKLVDYAKEQKYIKDVDSDAISYSIWCFCRGYNADAVGRGIPKEEAVRNFRYSFSFLLDGLKA